jgi:DNA-binding transcriptional LysR family regulator
MQDMFWDDLRYFLALHRAGSLKGAARGLGVDPTTVGRRLAALEEAVGARLFTRTADGLEASPAARALLPRAERIEAEVLASQRELEGADRRLEGPLRVTAGDGLINDVILPALAELRRAHPALTVELVAETRLADLSRREADVAIRLVRPREPALLARRLGEMRFALFAAQSYLDRAGTPRALPALAGHDFIGFEAALDRLPQVRWLRRTVPGLRYVVRANNTTSQARACAEGLGVALLPIFTGAREPRLRILFPRQAGPVRELWGVSHADLRGNVRVSAFLSWLSDQLKAGNAAVGAGG